MQQPTTVKEYMALTDEERKLVTEETRAKLREEMVRDMGPCQVCDQEDAVGVGASPLGPISLAYCKTCLEHHTEARWLVEFTLASCGSGWSHVADWVKDAGFTVYVDGKRVPIVEFYSDEDIKRLMEEQIEEERKYAAEEHLLDYEEMREGEPPPGSPGVGE